MNIFPIHEVPTTALKSLPALARQWSTAIERGKGVRLNAADLELLTLVGVYDLLQAAAAQYLKETTLCRKTGDQSPYTSGENTGSTGTARETEPSAPGSPRYFGTTIVGDASALLAHAQAMSVKRG